MALRPSAPSRTTQVVPRALVNLGLALLCAWACLASPKATAWSKSTKAERQARQRLEADPEAPNNRKAARSLAEAIAHAAPGVRTHQVHWLIGVDVSGSFDAMLPAVQSVLKTLAHRTMVPGDRITLYALDDEVRRFPAEALTLKGDNDARKSEFQDLVRHLQTRPGRRGTVFDDCRRQLFEHASRIAHDDAARIPVIVLIADRDTSDSAAAHDRELSSYTGQFGGSSSTKVPYAADSIRIDAGGKPKELPFIVSTLRKLDGKRTASVDRQKPVEPERKVVTPASDPSHHWRVLLFWAPLGTLIATVMAGLVTARLPAGRLVASHLGVAVPLRWGHAGLHLPASRNAAGLALTPSRSGLGEPQVLHVRMHAPNLRGGSVRLSTVDPYQLKDANGLWEREVVLKPREDFAVRIRDANGEVARGELKWDPSRDWKTWAIITIGCAAFTVIALPLDSLSNRWLPPPVPERTTVTRAEPL